MKKFEVTIRETEIYHMIVEAEDSNAAREKGWDILTDEEGAKQKYHDESDGESSAYEI